MKYEEPNLDIIYFNMLDVVTASGDLEDGSDNPDREPW